MRKKWSKIIIVIIAFLIIILGYSIVHSNKGSVNKMGAWKSNTVSEKDFSIDKYGTNGHAMISIKLKANNASIFDSYSKGYKNGDTIKISKSDINSMIDVGKTKYTVAHDLKFKVSGLPDATIKINNLDTIINQFDSNGTNEFTGGFISYSPHSDDLSIKLFYKSKGNNDMQFCVSNERVDGSGQYTTDIDQYIKIKNGNIVTKDDNSDNFDFNSVVCHKDELMKDILPKELGKVYELK